MARSCRVTLLGDFRVEIDGRDIGAGEWSGRRAADLVKILALAPRHRVHRDQVIDSLWPELRPEAGTANCRKAIHFARRALGDDDSIAVENEIVALWPKGELEVDVDRFHAAASDAIKRGDPEVAGRVVDTFPYDLLPDDPYAGWSVEARAQTRRLYLELLRLAGRWDAILELDPLDEQAHRELMRVLAATDRRQEAIRLFDRLRRALSDELGIGPHRDTVALYEEILAEEGTEPATPEERARSHIAAGLVALSRMDAKEAEKEAKLAREIARAELLAIEVGEASGVLGMAAHMQGRWKEAFREEFEQTLQEVPQFAEPVFDAHLCLAEFSLHGIEKPEEVANFARELLEVAGKHNSVPATALATLLLGVAELHSGDLDAAERDLGTAAELSDKARLATAHAFSLHRLAQVALARERHADTTRSLERAREAAADSNLQPHLFVRIHGTGIQAATDPHRAVTLLEESKEDLSGPEICEPCSIDYRISATIALARSGAIEEAADWLQRAERVAGMWQGGPWQASVWEARAELRLAEGELQQAIAHFTEAAQLFDAAGHPPSAARCRHRASLIAS